MATGKKKGTAATQALPLTASKPELLVDGSDQTLRRLTLGFAVLGWLLTDVREGFAKLLGISPFQYVALQAIARVQSDEPWTARSLATHFRVTTPYVSMELRPLISKGYLSAQASPQDRRFKILTVTAEGAALLTRLAPIQQQVNNTLYGQFDQAGLVKQYETIERMIRDAEAADAFLKQTLLSRQINPAGKP